MKFACTQMPKQTLSLVTFILILFTSGCGGVSNIQIQGTENSIPLPANYVDARPESDKLTHKTEHSIYYADDHLSPSLAVLFLHRLNRELGPAIGTRQVTLTRADTVVTTPESPPNTGLLGYFVVEKYVRVDIAGKIGEEDFSYGTYRSFHAGPSDGDIRMTIDAAINQAIAAIKTKKLVTVR